MKKTLLFLAIATISLYAQVVPVPTTIAYAYLVTPNSSLFSALPAAVQPKFAPILYVFVTVQNAPAGSTYTISVVGMTSNYGSYSLASSVTPNNPVSPWATLVFNLQPGDSLTGPITVSTYIPANVIPAILLGN